jgi:hypothetical protein
MSETAKYFSMQADPTALIFPTSPILQIAEKEEKFRTVFIVGSPAVCGALRPQQYALQ